MMRKYFDCLDEKQLLYTDTDSLWVTAEGFSRLSANGFIHGENLGSLKVVACHENVEFWGIKNYVADGRIVRAGVGCLPTVDIVSGKSRPIHRHVNADLAAGEQPQAIESAANHGDRPPYKHGIVGPEGWVKPWRIS